MALNSRKAFSTESSAACAEDWGKKYGIFLVTICLNSAVVKFGSPHVRCRTCVSSPAAPSLAGAAADVPSHCRTPAFAATSGDDALVAWNSRHLPE